jgi:ribonucleoside-diphosphate reductase alpha chain
MRRRLTDRRPHEAVQTEFRGAPYSIGVGRFEDGSLAEIFIDCQAKGLTPLSDDAKDAAVALSIALQYGAPAHVIREAVTRTADGSATGIIGHVLDLLEGSQ